METQALEHNKKYKYFNIHMKVESVVFLNEYVNNWSGRVWYEFVDSSLHHLLLCEHQVETYIFDAALSSSEVMGRMGLIITALRVP